MRIVWAVLAVGVLALAACAAEEPVSPEADAAAKALVPAPHAALLYVYRRTGGASPGTVARVFVRPRPGAEGGPGAQTLSLGERAYGVAEVPAGPVHVTVVVTHGLSTGSDNTTLTLAEGATVYLEVRTNPMALAAAAAQDPRLFVRPPEEGRADLSRARLSGVIRFAVPSS